MRSTLCLLLVGCASVQHPFTELELRQEGSGAALVKYLGQPEASTSVCDNQAVALSVGVSDALMTAFITQRMTAASFRGCIERSETTLTIEQASSLSDSLVRGIEVLIRDQKIDASPDLLQRLITLHTLYLERPNGHDPHASVIEPFMASLRTDKPVAPVASRLADELVATNLLEREGSWHGQQIDLAVLDALAAEGNVLTLTRFSQRLGSRELRTEAQRRLVRVQIALSSFQELRDEPVPVVNTVLMSGANRVVLQNHKVLRAWLDANTLVSRTVVVHQQPNGRSASLMGALNESSTPSLLPEISFRNVLWAQLDGLSRPVTVCGAAKAFDPTPCLDEEEVTVDQPLVRRDGSGSFRVNEFTDATSAIELAASERFVVPVRLDGTLVAQATWGLRYERPNDLRFTGSNAEAGPSLAVEVDLLPSSRAVFTVNDGTRIQKTVVEASDLASFRIISEGGSGWSGSDGSSGASGAPGGQCQNGSDGQAGGNGGSGGAGGNGGNIDVVYSCGALECSRPTVAMLRRAILSLGGDGGSGGAGGSGGQGGSGGSSQSATTQTDWQGGTVTSDGCSAGSNGRSGSSGSSGSNGQRGTSGFVRFTQAPLPGSES